MTQRINFNELTNLGSVANPTQAQDAATKSYVDSRPSSANTINYDGSGYTNITINGTVIMNLSALSGSVSTITFAAGSAQNAIDLTNYFNEPDHAGVYLYRFAGSDVSFTISSASANGNNVDATLPTPANFTTTVAAGSTAQNFNGTSTPFTDLAIGNNMTGTLTPAPTGSGMLLTLDSVNNGVTKVIAGTNISISPTTGVGNVTINATGGGGGTSLQGLTTDVQITEPSYARVGTFTVTAVDAAPNSIDVSSSVIGVISIGDDLRGGTTTPSNNTSSLRVTYISPSGTNVQFATPATGTFAVGNNVYRLPKTIDGASLVYSNTPNKWIAQLPTNYQAADLFTWSNKYFQTYVTDITIGIVDTTVTTNPNNLALDWGFPSPTIAGLVDGAEVYISDAFGRCASGRYVAGVGSVNAVLADVKIDRLSGSSWVIDSNYSVKVRSGKLNTGTVSFGFRDDFIVDSLANVPTSGNLAFNGRVLTDAANNGFGLLRLDNDTSNGAYITGQLIGFTTVPTNFVNGTSLYVCSEDGLFSISGVLSVSSAMPPIYTLEGNFNSNEGYAVSAGQYGIQAGKVIPSDVTSINGVTRDAIITGGNGIGVTTSGQTITVNNASASTIGSTTSFVNQQYSDIGNVFGIAGFITSPGTNAARVYAEIGFDGDTEQNDGGYIGTTKYVGTPQTAPSGSGNPLQLFVAAQYTEIEVDAWMPSYTQRVVTAAPATNGFTTGRVLFSRSTSGASNDPQLNANLFPPFQGNGSDDLGLIPVQTPSVTWTAVSGMTNTYDVSVGVSQWRGVSNNYTLNASTLSQGYKFYLPIVTVDVLHINSLVSTTQTSAPGGARILISLPGNGSVPNLQQVTQQGNTTNQALVLQDTQGVPKAVTLGVPASLTNNYTLKFPLDQGANMQALLNDGSGNLYWGTVSGGGGNIPDAIGFEIGGGVSSHTPPTTIAFNNSTRVFTLGLASGVTTYNIWIQGQKFAITTAQTVTVPNTAGLYYITFQIVSGNPTLVASLTPYDLEDQAPVSILYWSSTLSAQQYLGDERHWQTMDWKTHLYLHQTRGTAYASGFAISGSTTGAGTLPADAQIGLSSGTIYDEDIRFDLTGNVAGTFQTAIMYRIGSEWRKDALSIYPYKFGTATASYNQNVSGTWQLTDVGNGNYGVMFVCATNDVNTPFITLMGQGTYNTLNLATAVSFADLDVSNLPFTEFKVLYQLVFLTRTTYTNAVKVAQKSFIDYRTTITAVSVPSTAVDVVFRDAPAQVFASDATASAAWNAYIATQNSPGIWLTGSGDPADSLGSVGNYYQDISQTTPGNKVWLKTQTTTSPYWVRQTNLENAILSYTAGKLTFGFARLLATANIASLSGLPMIDSVQTVAGDVVLLAGQTTQSQNGLWVVASSAWTRATTSVIQQGLVIVISSGTLNGGDSWVETSPIVTIGTDPQVWVLFAENGSPTLRQTFTASSTLASRGVPFTYSVMQFGADLGSLATTMGLDQGTGDFYINNPTGIRLVAGQATSTAVLIADSSVANTSLTLSPKGTSNLLLGNSSYAQLQLTGGASTSLSLAPVGSNTNISVSLSPKGSSALTLGNTGTYSGFGITGGQTTFTELYASGSAANVDLVLTPKGTGNLYPLGPSLSSTVANQPKIYVASSKGSTTLSAGSFAQVLTSNGTGGSPFWSAFFSTTGRITKATTQTISNQTNTILTWDATVTPPAGFTFSSGTFTNSSSTLTRTVSVSAVVPWQNTSGSSISEIDIWVGSTTNINTRYSQIVQLSVANNTSGLASINATFDVAGSGTFAIYAWCASGSLILGGLQYGCAAGLQVTAFGAS